MERGPGIFWNDFDDLVPVSEEAIAAAEAGLQNIEQEFCDHIHMAVLDLIVLTAGCDDRDFESPSEKAREIRLYIRRIADTAPTHHFESVGRLAQSLDDVLVSNKPSRIIRRVVNAGVGILAMMTGRDVLSKHATQPDYETALAQLIEMREAAAQ